MTSVNRGGALWATSQTLCKCHTLLESPMKFVTKFLANESGATAIEYGLIAALIAVAAITAMQTLGGKLNTTFQNVSGKLV